MRHIKRLARPGRPRSSRRRPPQRLWVVRLRRIGLVVLALALVVGAGFAFLRSSVAERWAADLRRKAVAASVEAGFVVERVYSEGRSLADEATLKRTLEPHHGQPIFTVELEKLKATGRGPALGPLAPASGAACRTRSGCGWTSIARSPAGWTGRGRCW